MVIQGVKERSGGHIIASQRGVTSETEEEIAGRAQELSELLPFDTEENFQKCEWRGLMGKT